MEFVAELASLLDQIPPGRVATVGELAAALGDTAAARAVFHVVREDARLENRHRVVTADGRPVAPAGGRRLRAEHIDLDGGRVREVGAFAFKGFSSERPLEKLREEQLRLRGAVRSRDGVRRPRTVAGFDLAYAGGFALAAGVVCSFPKGEALATAVARERVTFPYIPGYLAYREAPAILACHAALDMTPDVVLVDGHGVLHPARFGLACLVGVRLGAPTIGCAKSLLVGRLGRMPPPRGSARIFVDGDVAGRALRPGRSRRLVFVSVGHRVSLRTAVRIVRTLCYSRIPEPLRIAHERATEMRKRMRKRL